MWLALRSRNGQGACRIGGPVEHGMRWRGGAPFDKHAVSMSTLAGRRYQECGSPRVNSGYDVTTVDLKTLGMILPRAGIL